MILTKKIYHCIVITSLIFTLNIPLAIALKSDSDQPIQIDARKQTIDFKNNITTFTDNVIIKQGSIEVRANTVIISHPNGNIKHMIVEAYGKQATFYQLQDDGKSLKGKSNKIRYETEKQILILTGNAYLEQLNNNINGDKIIYSIQTKQLRGFSNTGKKVTTILIPTQLYNKNNNTRNINNKSE